MRSLHSEFEMYVHFICILRSKAFFLETLFWLSAYYKGFEGVNIHGRYKHIHVIK